MTHSIIVRDLDVELAAVPRHWCADSAAATAISNGVNLLFPHGERFFVRSVKHFLGRVESPTLRAQVKAFFGQEGHHAREHDRLNAVLRAQGFEIDEFLTRFEKVTRWVEGRSSPELNLAITAACEHFTAILAEGAFEGGILDACHPLMQQLLGWHAAEELEHKSVAYDVLQLVDPSYARRVLGLVLATAILGGFWAWAATVLMKQDGLTWRTLLKQLNAMPNRDPVVKRVFWRGIKLYLKRDFHPANTPTEQMAEKWFATRGFAMPEAA